MKKSRITSEFVDENTLPPDNPFSKEEKSASIIAYRHARTIPGITEEEKVNQSLLWNIDFKTDEINGEEVVEYRSKGVKDVPSFTVYCRNGEIRHI